MIPHPTKTLITRGEMASLIAVGNHLCLRKFDGELTELNIDGAVVVCEAMRGEISGHFYTPSDRAMFARHGVWYAALTVSSIDGESVLEYAAAWRWEALKELADRFPANMVLAETVKDVDATMASGAEGVVAVPWNAPWNHLVCHKANSIYVCRVTSTGGSQSVGIADAVTGQDRGRLMLGGGACDKVRVGSIVRCEAVSEHVGGKLRQATKCREWLVKA